MTDELRDFERFMKQRTQAAQSYVNGEAGPLDEVVARNDPASFFPPRGGIERGAERVASTYANDAKGFDGGSENELEILHLGASDGLAYWVGVQRASVRLRGKEKRVPFRLRVTELFRREGGSWKLIHRHADSQLEPAEPST